MITAQEPYDDDFLTIVYGDDALVRAEFDDVIASNWDGE
jgi:hypothetical protein